MAKAHTTAPKTPKPVEPTPPPVDPPEPTDVAAVDPSGEDGLLSTTQLQSFAAASTPHERLVLLSAYFRVEHYASNPRSLVWVDMCFGVLTFALEEAKLSEPKTLALLQVANEVFSFATSPSFEADAATPFPSTEATYDVFRHLVRSHSVASDVSPSDCQADARWDTTDVMRIVAFMSSTFFRHLAAYQYVFQFPRPSLEREIALVVESPLPPLPLATASQE